MSSIFQSNKTIFKSNLPAVKAAINAGALKALRSAADIGRNAVITNLSGMRKGKRYRVPGTGKKDEETGHYLGGVYYTASAPNEYPAVATGLLKESVKIIQEGEGFLVGTEVEYGIDLEDPDKTRKSGRREWLRKSFLGVKKEMLAAVGDKRWF